MLRQIILYALPLFATNILQILFNAADVAVLGIFASDDAVAAVGSNGSLIGLITGLFVGLSVGSNVLVARCVGTQNREVSGRVVGTSILMGAIIGFLLLAVGYYGAETFLVWMDCDADVLPMAVKYLKIYFLGMPIMMLYNFCAAILRAVGDTVRPLIYLVVGGIVNVGLNVLLVQELNVEGVAIATVASQAIAAVLAIIALLKSDGYARFNLRDLRIYPKELKDIVVIGIPAGMQSCLFSVCNVMIQSSINSFGKVAMAGNTVASQLDSFIYQSSFSVALACLVFVSQNFGAGKFDRVRKAVKTSVLVACGISILVASLVLLFRIPLCRIITQDPAVIEFACLRLFIMATTYFTCGIMDTMCSVMRGLGHSTLAMMITLLGTCVFRIIWLSVVFPMPQFHSLTTVYLSYPISWTMTSVIYFALYPRTLKNAREQFLFQSQNT